MPESDDVSIRITADARRAIADLRAAAQLAAEANARLGRATDALNEELPEE